MEMKRSLLAFSAALLAFSACTSHFISDAEYRQAVIADLESRQDVLDAAGVDIDAAQLKQDEREALEFLYAYMPLGDIVNMGMDYYLDSYRMTVKALDEMPWGDRIPERELRHFVLPVRVNNENLDSCRTVFYEELAPRVKGMSMHDAVLEVNRWCHEKAVYMPTDRRTSSPLATVKTAYGRCGEESTLLVAALRSVGIPARQVYTPRWAHTDSNHAWVEAWVDGRWHFLGACEPEPVLDLGWFNAPASRGMLMHTKVWGRYDGPEEKVCETPLHTEINVIGHYAPESAAVRVRVLDEALFPVEGADVSFQIYNYSEFSTVAVKKTDAEGRTALTAGIGDIMVYACKDGRFGLSKISCGKEPEKDIVLKYAEGMDIPHMEMDIVPPAENAVLPEVTPEQRLENTCRMEYGDSLRNAYVASFCSEENAIEFASVHSLDPRKTVEILVSSRGNHSEIASFLSRAAAEGYGQRALELLESISEKDLRDTPASVLEDHLYSTPQDADASHVLCPRVSTELLTPYRRYFQENIPESLADSVRTDPALLVNWCRKHLSLHDDISLRHVQLAPQRVWETHLADKGSRDIFFVALCRSLGVPAWQDPVTGTVRYENDGRVYDVDFEAHEQAASPKGRLMLRYSPISMLKDPEYETHFTLSRFDGSAFRLLEYGESCTWASHFREPAVMDCGYYMLVSGSRMSGGNVITDVEFLTVREGETTVADLVVRDVDDQIRVIGSFDSEIRYMALPDASSDISEAVQTSVLQTTGRGYFAVLLVDYGTEPTNHAFMDISAASAQLEEWGRPLLVVFASAEDYAKFRSESFRLPSTVHFGVDADGSMRRMMTSGMKLDNEGSLPLVVLADTFNRVLFFSQGYNIGLGERLVRTSKVL